MISHLFPVHVYEAETSVLQGLQQQLYLSPCSEAKTVNFKTTNTKYRFPLTPYWLLCRMSLASAQNKTDRQCIGLLCKSLREGRS